MVNLFCTTKWRGRKKSTWVFLEIDLFLVFMTSSYEHNGTKVPDKSVHEVYFYRFPQYTHVKKKPKKQMLKSQWIPFKMYIKNSTVYKNQTQQYVYNFLVPVMNLLCLIIESFSTNTCTRAWGVFLHEKQEDSCLLELLCQPWSLAYNNPPALWVPFFMNARLLPSSLVTAVIWGSAARMKKWWLLKFKSWFYESCNLH